MDTFKSNPISTSKDICCLMSKQALHTMVGIVIEDDAWLDVGVIALDSVTFSEVQSLVRVLPELAIYYREQLLLMPPHRL